jgi:hypothetical protein
MLPKQVFAANQSVGADPVGRLYRIGLRFNN